MKGEPWTRGHYCFDS